MRALQVAEAGQEVQEVQGKAAAASTALQQAQGDQQRCSEGLSAVSGPLLQQARQLQSALATLLDVLPHSSEVTDAGATLMDLRKFTQVCPFQTLKVHVMPCALMGGGVPMSFV